MTNVQVLCSRVNTSVDNLSLLYGLTQFIWAFKHSALRPRK